MGGLLQAIATDNLHALYALDCLGVTNHLEIMLVSNTARQMIQNGIHATVSRQKLAIMTRLISMLKRTGKEGDACEVFGTHIDGPIKLDAEKYEVFHPESRGDGGPVEWVAILRWRWAQLNARQASPL
jgi:hypothetical protein